VTVESVLAQLNEIVRPDGAELRVAERSATALRLELDLTNSDCPECVVPKDLMLDILRTNLATVDPDIREIDLHDPREVS
jgi:hypothetical protein